MAPEIGRSAFGARKGDDCCIAMLGPARANEGLGAQDSEAWHNRCFDGDEDKAITGRQM